MSIIFASEGIYLAGLDKSIEKELVEATKKYFIEEKIDMEEYGKMNSRIYDKAKNLLTSKLLKNEPKKTVFRLLLDHYAHRSLDMNGLLVKCGQQGLKMDKKGLLSVLRSLVSSGYIITDRKLYWVSLEDLVKMANNRIQADK